MLVLLYGLEGLVQLAQHPLSVTFIITAIAVGRRWVAETEIVELGQHAFPL